VLLPVYVRVRVCVCTCVRMCCRVSTRGAFGVEGCPPPATPAPLGVVLYADEPGLAESVLEVVLLGAVDARDAQVKAGGLFRG
jgi:hypothetical protein